MNNESPLKAVIVVTTTAFLCSVVVTVAAVMLQPMQRAYEDLERNRAVVAISGLTDRAAELSDREIVTLFQELEARIVDLESGAFDERYNPGTFDTWKSAGDPALSTAIPAKQDLAKLNRRSRLVTVYLVKDANNLKRMLLPIYGQGMWSTLYGFLALEPDLNTIADITFFEQAETAGIGDKILKPAWQASWRGKKLYDENGKLRLGLVSEPADATALAAVYGVDAISGATITVGAVTNLVRYWFGPHGFEPFLEAYRVGSVQ
ncbi:MAG: Na(+)-translocating NADH-quinone reductase subunit C [Gammaproteobacteria bacterium]|nr:Na(+)-translocating NADH-quinone reductase subunit C [Gammaproteobacteria bacterium]